MAAETRALWGGLDETVHCRRNRRRRNGGIDANFRDRCDDGVRSRLVLISSPSPTLLYPALLCSSLLCSSPGLPDVGGSLTVVEHIRARGAQWEAAGDISARTAQRYRQLVENQIVPHLGAKLVQKLKRSDIEAWHTTPRTDGRQRGEGGEAAEAETSLQDVVGVLVPRCCASI